MSPRQRIHRMSRSLLAVAAGLAVGLALVGGPAMGQPAGLVAAYAFGEGSGPAAGDSELVATPCGESGSPGASMRCVSITER